MSTPADRPRLSAPQRYARVLTVLVRVMILNLAVALVKIVYGYVSGSVSILSDGFHSLTDTAANVIAIVGVRVARQPPDSNHPYGHRKYETLATGGVLFFLTILVLELMRALWGRLREPEPLQVAAEAFGVMALTLAVNIFVVRYESRAGERLASELLLADAKHTRSDLMTSATVIAALIGTRAGFPVLDPLAGLVVTLFIAKAGYDIARDALAILADTVVMDAEDIAAVVMEVPGVLGCHQVRTRGTADHVFLDLHLWLPPETPLAQAHERSHVVKDRVMRRYPQIVDAVIHIEPPPVGWTATDSHPAFDRRR